MLGSAREYPRSELQTARATNPLMISGKWRARARCFSNWRDFYLAFVSLPHCADSVVITRPDVPTIMQFFIVTESDSATAARNLGSSMWIVQGVGY